ncbi:Tetratricopeptide (TPR) repeat (TPR) [Fructobacillus tropaeoli]|nr:Tetratricopeptide (TPR) repeat (TPR) [Fructobacillus tropaeoli]
MESYINRGINYARQKEYKKAILDYNKAIKLDPKNVGAYYHFVIVSLSCGDYQDTLEKYKELVILDREAAQEIPYINPHDEEKDVGKGINNDYYFEFVEKFLICISEIKTIKNYVLNTALKYFKSSFKYADKKKQEDLIGSLYAVLKVEKYNKSDEELKNAEDLSDYLLNVLDFLLEAEVDSKNLEQYFYQYTNKDVLSSITVPVDAEKKTHSKFKLRLYNSDYMNDPDEGKFLTHGIHDNSKNYIDLDQSRIYLASLSQIEPFDTKSLPMWNVYGDANKGICFSLKLQTIESVDSNTQQLPDNFESSFVENNLSDKHVETGVYRVFYENEINSPVSDIIKNIRTFLKSFYKKPEIYSTWENLVFDFLDKIRFLYKSDIYSYEQEIRILKEVIDYEDTYYDENGLKLYTNLGTDDGLQIELAEISFGTKFDDYYLWTHRANKEINTKESNSLKFRKINFPYR